MKRLLSLLVAFALILACAPAIPLQATAATSGYYTYTVSGGKATITDCDTSISGEITIPATLGGYPVTGIGQYAFSGCSSLESIVIPDSVTSIGSYAFRDCSSLTIVNFNATNCETMGSYFDPVFARCTSLTTVIFGDNVRKIPDCAFVNQSSLISVTIPDSVTSIGSAAFYNCSSLTNVYITDIAAWCNIDFYDPLANPLYCAKNLYLNGELVTDLIIPDSVTGIGSSAFYNCSSLESVVIPDSVTSIGSYTFYNCSNLASATIENGVTSIGDFAFHNCSSLTSVVIPDSVTGIGSYAFDGCKSLTGATIGNRATDIGSAMFYNCSSLTSVTIGNSVTNIGSYAFDGCSSLESIVIPDSVTRIGSYAFRDCSSLTTIYYGGTEEQKAMIAIDPYNDPLLNANWIYAAPAVCEYLETGKETATKFETMEKALAAATSGTVKLLADTTADTVVLKPGVTLDLNGYTLTANLLVAMDGAKVTDGTDCIGGGSLKIAKGNLALAIDNGGVIPVWNGVDGYVFTKVIFQQMTKTAGEGAAQYIFLPNFSNAEAAALMADGGTDNGVKVKVCLTWNNGQSQQLYTYSDDLLKLVFDGTNQWVFDLKVTGIAGITDMVASAVIATDSGTQATATDTKLVAG